MEKIKWIELKAESESTLPAVLGMPKNEKKLPVVLQQLRDGSWDVMRVVNKLGACSSPMVTCKTLTSAKRWVSRYYLAKAA